MVVDDSLDRLGAQKLRLFGQQHLAGPPSYSLPCFLCKRGTARVSVPSRQHIKASALRRRPPPPATRTRRSAAPPQRAPTHSRTYSCSSSLPQGAGSPAAPPIAAPPPPGTRQTPRTPAAAVSLSAPAPAGAWPPPAAAHRTVTPGGGPGTGSGQQGGRAHAARKCRAVTRTGPDAHGSATAGGGAVSRGQSRPSRAALWAARR